MSVMKVGFVGIGLMGSRMVKRLLEAGFSVRIWNRSIDKCVPLQEAGATVMTSPADLTRHCDVVMMCVADGDAVEAVVFGDEGIAQGGISGKLLVDFSSIEPDHTRTLAMRLLQQCGMHWIDAPVSGGTEGAEKGTLVIMAGGRAADVDHLRLLLAPLAQRVTRMGDVGAGQVTKVCNQLIVAANSLLIAEAVALAEKGGVNASLLAQALEGGFADSLPFRMLAPRMATRQHEPVQWKVTTLAKDLNNAMRLANASDVPVNLAAHAAQTLQDFAESGHGDEDLSSIIRLYRP